MDWHVSEVHLPTAWLRIPSDQAPCAACDCTFVPVAGSVAAVATVKPPTGICLGLLLSHQAPSDTLLLRRIQIAWFAMQLECNPGAPAQLTATCPSNWYLLRTARRTSNLG